MAVVKVEKKLTTPWAPSRGWPVTDRGGRASLLPCTPAGGWVVMMMMKFFFKRAGGGGV